MNIIDSIIRPLEWEEDGYGNFRAENVTGCDGVDVLLHADDGSVALYEVWGVDGEFETPEAAQAAAEADYRARIASVLDLTAVERLVEAGEPLLNMLMFAESAGDGEAVIMRAGTIRNLRAALAAFKETPK